MKKQLVVQLDKYISKEDLLKLKVKERTALFMADLESMSEFCSYVAQGGHLAGFCQEHGLKYKYVYDWITEDPARNELYACAKLHRADVLADELVAIADEKEVKATYNGEEVTLILDATAVARNRLRVDTRKWVASKLRPATYGDKTTTELVGANGGPVQLSAVNLKGLTNEELIQMQELMTRAAARLPAPMV